MPYKTILNPTTGKPETYHVTDKRILGPKGNLMIRAVAPIAIQREQKNLQKKAKGFGH